MTSRPHTKTSLFKNRAIDIKQELKDVLTNFTIN